MEPAVPKSALPNASAKASPSGKWLVLLTVLGFWAFLVLALLGAWVGNKVGGDPAGRGMLGGLLASVCILTAILFGIVAIIGVFVVWKRIGWRIRILPFLPLFIFVPLAAVGKYGTPTTDLVLSYVGSKSEIVIDFTGHRIDAGNHQLKKNVPELVSSGQDLRRIHVTWGESYNSKPNDKRFELSKEIPALGKDRTIIVTLGDKDATCEVKQGRYNALVQ